MKPYKRTPIEGGKQEVESAVKLHFDADEVDFMYYNGRFLANGCLV